MSQTIILTGSTGFIGSSLLGDILRNDSTATVRLIVRAASAEAALQRVIEAAAVTAPDLDPAVISARCEVFVGDLTIEGLGIGNEGIGIGNKGLGRLAKGATHIIHCASSVSFQQTLEEARATNVEGARRMLSLARRVKAAGTLQRFSYVSTAYVSGDRHGRIMEEESAVPNRFSNSYERSKYEAESLVREAMQELPCTILRPSIVVGHSQTGRTLCFNVLYIPLRFIASGLIREFSGRPDVPMDVVPVDFVSRAIYELSCRLANTEGQTYHLTMGDMSTTAGEVVRTALAFFCGTKGNTTSNLTFVSPDAASPSRSAKAVEMFESYVSLERVFDNSRTLEALASIGIKPPTYASYCQRLYEYSETTRWGKGRRLSNVA